MLIECRECGKKISDQAQVCIGCGAPISVSVDDGVGDVGRGRNRILPEDVTLGKVVETDVQGSKSYYGKILNEDGEGFLFLKNILVVSEADISSTLSSSDLKVGDVVYFEEEFNEEGRLVKIIIPDMDEAQRKVICGKFPDKGNGIIRVNKAEVKPDQGGSVVKKTMIALLVIVFGGVFIFSMSSSPSRVDRELSEIEYALHVSTLKRKDAADYEAAFNFFKNQALSGDLRSTAILAKMYYSGDFVEKNNSEAHELAISAFPSRDSLAFFVAGATEFDDIKKVAYFKIGMSLEKGDFFPSYKDSVGKIIQEVEGQMSTSDLLRSATLIDDCERSGFKQCG